MIMRRVFADHLVRLDSPAHRLPTGVKLIAAMALITATLLVPIHRAWIFAVLAAILLLLMLLARLPVRGVLVRLLIFEPIVLGVAGLALLSPDGWRIFLSILRAAPSAS